jgi:hypothetical protein
MQIKGSKYKIFGTHHERETSINPQAMIALLNKKIVQMEKNLVDRWWVPKSVYLDPSIYIS